jgi:RimJ/RimL family protein N-acetyltransferase
MRHSLTTQGYGVRLRPVRLDDARFIVWLRNLDHVKGRVGDSATNVAGQERWLNSYFEREGDYYFIVETFNETPLGTNSVYNLQETCAEYGRLAIRPGVKAGTIASLLLYDFFFGHMGITQLQSMCVASNLAIHAFLRKHGFRQAKVECASQVIGGEAVDMIQFVLTAEDWLNARETRIPAAQRVELANRQWEEVYRQSRAACKERSEL